MTRLVDTLGPKWSIHDINSDTDPNVSYNNETDLYESLLVESCDIYGSPVEIYLINLNNPDKIYGEDQNATYTGPFRSKVIYTPVEESHLIQSFGMIADETISYMQIPIYTWNRDVTTQREAQDEPYQSEADTRQPVAGDIIRPVWDYGKSYEVVDSNTDANVFQLSKLTFNLIVKIVKFSEQDDVLGGLMSSAQVSSWGDNNQIEVESQVIDDYSDLENLEDLFNFS
jgi:hypothetical protein